MTDEYKKNIVEMPIIPLRGIWFFPHTVIHFDVGREKSIKALEEALLVDSKILLCSQKDFKVEEPTAEDFYHIGTVAIIKQTLRLPNGSTRVLVEGLHRGIIESFIEEDYFKGHIEEIIYKSDEQASEDGVEEDEQNEEELTEHADKEEIESEEDLELKAMMRIVLDDAKEYFNLHPNFSKEIIMTFTDVEDGGILSDMIAFYLNVKNEDYYEIISTLDIFKRLEKLHQILKKEIEILKIEEQINTKVTKSISRNQKEYYLKEQLQAIREELGEQEEVDDIANTYKKKIKALKLKKESETYILKELERMVNMGSGAPEVGIIRNYLDHVLDLPWNKKTKDKLDIKEAKKILDENHYGLKDVKERILEFIAVKKLKNSLTGSIICLVGPPGVGKTSIAKSIAKAMNRNFVSMRLGGVRDEAEIRGHRRTYIGSMPGRIIHLMEKAKSNNPVFLLDEVDKLGSDFSGDPTSALLEVLDPAQNDEFIDRYMEIPFDLSNVMFITTANSKFTIPPALLDRMEVINVEGYTSFEKEKIAEKYLVPKMIKKHGLEKYKIEISINVIRELISNYTRESGVRNLEREIEKICRRAAKKVVEENIKSLKITVGNLEKYSGKKKFLDDDISREDEIGVVNGLAWTIVGGEILVVESNVMDGTGKVQLTGKLGDVMKESALAAISYIRTNAKKLGISGLFYKNKDIHIHFPEGAIPKDGPSAGITMATALVSTLTKKKVNHNFAMTGEITTRGKVLPIGGVKEKVLAARRYGIKNVIMPEKNKRDLEELPKEARNDMKFYFVKDINQVLDLVLIDSKKEKENED